eukprot:GHRQ01011935.1.p2 GENE.GHRQ01011935.1~~GHRQ01011935.1.p2  ORF type:complete len:125 (+),score=4.91 GHRQ01011935.1:1446-1820(+)
MIQCRVANSGSVHVGGYCHDVSCRVAAVGRMTYSQSSMQAACFAYGHLLHTVKGAWLTCARGMDRVAMLGACGVVRCCYHRASGGGEAPSGLGKTARLMNGTDATAAGPPSYNKVFRQRVAGGM